MAIATKRQVTLLSLVAVPCLSVHNQCAYLLQPRRLFLPPQTALGCISGLLPAEYPGLRREHLNRTFRKDRPRNPRHLQMVTHVIGRLLAAHAAQMVLDTNALANRFVFLQP